MWLSRRKGLFESNRVLPIPLDDISPNPNQPRREFTAEGMEELAASVREFGILQPLSVRRIAGGYELVSGERRLRAARMAGLCEAPCIVLAVGEEESSLLALVENLQRRDLDFLEEALALERLIRTFGLSQEEAARRIGKSQSGVANKLRLLRMAPETLCLLRENGCTERHARALLRLPDEESRLRAARQVVERGLTVAATEDYVERLLAHLERPRSKTTFILKDIRLFLNTIDRSVAVMKSAGVAAKVDRTDTGEEILLTIRIPKSAS